MFKNAYTINLLFSVIKSDHSLSKNKTKQKQKKNSAFTVSKINNAMYIIYTVYKLI